MVFQGKVRSVTELLHAASTAPQMKSSAGFGVRQTAAENAAGCRALLEYGESPDDCWQFVILQTLDNYNSVLRRGGPSLAAQVFTEEPPRTGAVEIDAAFAALADHLPHLDGWPVPN